MLPSHADLSLLRRFPPPSHPFEGDYAERHEALLKAVFVEPALLEPFERGRQLPPGFGVGLDERVVEYPWLLAARPVGRALDAGSVLNHEHILDRFLPELESLTILTLEPEPLAFTDRKISYVYDDLRNLPFRDAWFDTIVSLSTLEHLGMDNALYGSYLSRADDADADLALAVAEMQRVLKPGGALLLSVPFGAFEDHGWFRQFGEEQLDRLLALLEPAEMVIEFFFYGADGWRRSDRRVAAGASYRRAEAQLAEDNAAAARAVACVSARFPTSV